MKDKIVELHFIDGPLQGTRKMEQESVVKINRTYRHLQPVSYGYEEKVSVESVLNHVRVTCIEYHYLPFRIPAKYYGPDRYAMVLEGNLR